MSKENIVNRVVAATLSDPATQQFLTNALSAHLQNHLAGEMLYVPKTTGVQRINRNQHIRQAIAAGTPLDELQVTYRVSKRTLYRLKSH